MFAFEFNPTVRINFRRASKPQTHAIEIIDDVRSLCDPLVARARCPRDGVCSHENVANAVASFTNGRVVTSDGE
jgi:hypothetical protein